MTRIVAGAARGRRLAVPPAGTRPTSDRVREALFSALEHALGSWSGRRVLDLYAGSGALGLEAASRGAEHVLLVERDRATAAVARRNAAAVAPERVDVVVADVSRLAAAAPPAVARPPYDVVLADPPYDVATADVAAALSGLREHGWWATGAVLVVERGTRSGAFAWPAGVAAVRDRRYGETTLWYGREEGPDRAPAPGTPD